MKNSQLKQKAKFALKGDFGLAIGVMLLAWLMSSAASSFFIIGAIFITYPVYIGIARFHFMVSKNQADIDTMFFAFKVEYMKQILTVLITRLLLVAWTLLLIIPGIIKTFSYALVPYLLMDEHYEVYDMDAITKSREMMNGQKARLFFLQLSFIGWFLIGIATFGLGFLYVGPYYQQTMLQFYLDVKSHDVDLDEVYQVVEEILPELQNEDSNEWDL